MSELLERPAARPSSLVLLEELVEASTDTVQLMAAHDLGVRWRAHLDYLRALCRRGRAALARLAEEESRRGEAETRRAEEEAT